MKQTKDMNMLPAIIDNDEPYRIAADRGQGLRVILFNTNELRRGGPITPLWWREAADERTFQALVRWTGQRRSLWAGWGRLAEAVGPEAFANHMRKVMNKQPLAEVQGTIVQRGDDHREIVLGEMLSGSEGLSFEELHRHRFPSPEASDRFFDWLYTDRNLEQAETLLQIAYYKGTLALSAALDNIAANAPAPEKSGAARVRKRVTA